jgi:type II secretory pathway pseudopilin PulG
MSLIFLMVFTAWAMAAVITVVDPSARTNAEDKTQRQFKKLQAAIAQYRANTGSWPMGLTGLLSDTAGVGACTMDTSPSSGTFRQLQGWCGPYLDQLYVGDTSSYRIDGHGTLIEYDGTAHTLLSYGKDRQKGTSDDVSFSL